MGLAIHERDGQRKEMGGRSVYWLQTPQQTGGHYSSVCTVVYDPGARAKPAHAHDNGEETIFVLSGTGKVKVGADVFGLEPGVSVLFPQGVPHMVWNTGDIPLHIVCFYGPAPAAIEYTYYEDFDFDEFLGQGDGDGPQP
ncbi:cupin domain-containing protein [Intestinibacillus massiliensis]|uniref:cupin domain-containing protein n=1 Tax=Intestinibacillus massiliensis TaxID=1871029 RepID=UPI0013563E1D|nr:cupin domain-containing protein [Intestinibacillus massiliensis]